MSAEFRPTAKHIANRRVMLLVRFNAWERLERTRPRDEYDR
jgi:hypothetical protein